MYGLDAHTQPGVPVRVHADDKCDAGSSQLIMLGGIIVFNLHIHTAAHTVRMGVRTNCVILTHTHTYIHTRSHAHT
jgi:multisubunit Na+/H+ antiporter MnhG subunit